jgi:hypothetical protein
MSWQRSYDTGERGKEGGPTCYAIISVFKMRDGGRANCKDILFPLTTLHMRASFPLRDALKRCDSKLVDIIDGENFTLH